MQRHWCGPCAALSRIPPSTSEHVQRWMLRAWFKRGLHTLPGRGRGKGWDAWGVLSIF